MKLTTSIAALASAGLSMFTAQGGTYTNFSNIYTFPYYFAPTSVTLSPYPMCINKPFCLNLTGNLSAAIIEGATYTIQGRYLGRLIYTDNDNDLCASLAAADTPCPISVGTSACTLSRNVKPNVPPNWPISYQYIATNGDGGITTAQKSNTAVIGTLRP